MDKKAFMQTSERKWYYGNLSDDEKRQNGIGLKREGDGSLYYGFWENGRRIGWRVLCEPDGSLVAGSWENNEWSDIRLKVYPAESMRAIFCGKFEGSEPEKGTLLCSDGKLYHGIFKEWRGENFDGEGALLWPDKRIYAGQWKNGKTHVGGVIRKENGCVRGNLSNVQNGYIAKSWQDEKEKQFFYGKTEDEEADNSIGILFYGHGEFFAGEIRDGKKTGFGVCRSTDENIYIGKWHNGVMQKWGICICQTADSISFYIGGLKNGLYEGEGCILCRMLGKWNFIYDGAWKMGVPYVMLGKVNRPGPSRKQYSKGDIVSQATFNSLKDVGEFGAEQYFVGIRADMDAPYQRTMYIEADCNYEIRIFYHNDADEKTAGEEGTARETRLRAFFTEGIRPGENGVVSASISFADNNIPIIWDGIIIQSAEDLLLRYKIASAKIYNSGKGEGRILPQTLFTERGVYLGVDELNGILPPGNSGYVTFIIHASRKKSGNRALPSSMTVPAENNSSRISISITAAARDGKYEKCVKADIGEEIYVKVAFTNGASGQNIIISVALPQAAKLVSGSSILKLSEELERRWSDDWIKDGLVLENFPAGKKGEIQFRFRYFPDGASSPDDMKVKAMVETADIIMLRELQITRR